jgi:hypothetical protein
LPPTLPNFFLVGAPKAGTTSLYHYLDQHPQIYMSPIKEPCFFSLEIRPARFNDDFQRQAAQDMKDLDDYLAGPVLKKRPGGIVQDWNGYLRLFADANGESAIGEASVCYLWSATAAAHIRERIPDAKIIMILRHPAERAFSQYVHGASAGWIRKPFREHLEANLRNRDQKFGMDFPLLEFGLYYEQVKRYLENFPRQNIRIGFYEEAHRQFADILRFLDVDASFMPDTSKRHLEVGMPRHLDASQYLKATGVWQRARRLCPPGLLPVMRRLVQRPRRTMKMDPKDRAFLLGYYREDVGKLAVLLNRDLSSWLK